ncbi:unnamed protein product [Parascedosporium putredinis]|uniref:Uncharacterized protein n=1 Tax=Parascedosporium putredinis TaxID=1442378 RepID=A0A9P1GZQ0_9PEZI|nr:unnamed protein product [Parascedosporium putredinis]CAI7991997.1 unnamed protein product [Parascedosporium putredinis]
MPAQGDFDNAIIVTLRLRRRRRRRATSYRYKDMRDNRDPIALNLAPSRIMAGLSTLWQPKLLQPWAEAAVPSPLTSDMEDSNS